MVDSVRKRSEVHSPNLANLLRRIAVFLVGAALFAPPMPVSPQAASATAGAQTVRPGDVIRLRIWREEGMSGDYIVDEAGSVVFPRVGEYSVLEETPATLQTKLLASYGRYLRDPNIDVIVLRRIIVRGAVHQPGLKMADPTITIADALALAGGATSLGDQNKIQIFRDGEVIAADISIDTRLADSIIRSGDQIFVPERSWVSRNAGLIATAASLSVTLLIALFIR